MFYLTSRASEM